MIDAIDREPGLRAVRRVEDITEASPSTVSDLNKKIYGTIEAWRNRPIEGEHPYVYWTALCSSAAGLARCATCRFCLRQIQHHRERAPRRRTQVHRSAVNERLVAHVGTSASPSLNLEINKLKCARLRGACGCWRCRCRLINRAGHPPIQITLRHTVSALIVVLKPDANGVAKIVRKARQIVDLVMDYHFVALANGLRIGDGNKDVPNLLSTPIHEHKVCLTFNLRF